MYTRIYVLKFPETVVDQPLIYRLVKDFDVELNILKAIIDLKDEGLMVLELRGHKANVQKGLAYLKDQGVVVERVAATVRRDFESCVQCGVCTGVCPTGALALKRPVMEVLFDPELCTSCGMCVAVCPVRAMEVTSDRATGSLG